MIGDALRGALSPRPHHRHEVFDSPAASPRHIEAALLARRGRDNPDGSMTVSDRRFEPRSWDPNMVPMYADVAVIRRDGAAARVDVTFHESWAAVGNAYLRLVIGVVFLASAAQLGPHGRPGLFWVFTGMGVFSLVVFVVVAACRDFSFDTRIRRIVPT